MKIKRIFNFICFFIIAPIATFISFELLIASFQTHQIKINLELYKRVEIVEIFDPKENKVGTVPSRNLGAALEKGYQLHNAGPRIKVSTPDGKIWDIKTSNLKTALDRGAKLVDEPKESDKDEFSQFGGYEINIPKTGSNFWEEFDAQGESFNPYEHGAIPINQNNKIISYWPTYPFLKDIFILSLVWTWLILAYRYLIKLFDSEQKCNGE